MPVVFKDNSATVKSAFNSGVTRSLTSIGMKWQQIQAPLVPVDTGYLRNSATASVDTKQLAVRVGYTAEYAPYNEYGTYRMKARPFLRPSVLDHMDEYKQIMERELASAMK